VREKAGFERMKCKFSAILKIQFIERGKEEEIDFCATFSDIE
jgi:hypothetical protein